jgi:oligopeptide/dipeptide ABC transporter ATP-binding protein
VTGTGDGALLTVDSLQVRFGGHRPGARPAAGQAVLDGVSLRMEAGGIVGIIGETGSGKTTLGRAIMGLVPAVGGRVWFEGVDVAALNARRLRALRRSGAMQMVFQDPLRSLDPDLTVDQLVGEGLAIRKRHAGPERADAIAEALELVGIPSALRGRRPGEISGGQRQRVAIARAIALRPRLLLCDEPVSALDASTRNFILDMLRDLRGRLGLSMLVISHDLVSVAGIADRVAVLYRGHILEEGPVGELFKAPHHPYTALLIASAPRTLRSRWNFRASPEQLRPVAADEIATDGTGCVFADRCRFASAICHEVSPPTTQVTPSRTVACHNATDWAAELAS